MTVNAFLTAKQISSLTVPLLVRSIVLPNTVSMIPAGEYSGPNGGTISVRTRAVMAARTQTTARTQIVWDDLTEAGVDVAVTHYYNANKVADEDLTLKLVDFGAQVLAPMIDGIAVAVEGNLAATMNGLSAAASQFALAPTAADTIAQLLKARQALTVANVPAGDRFLAVSPDIATRMLSVPDYTKINESGDSSALRDATIGRLYGFTVVESNALTAGSAVAYHRSALAFANFTPQPTGSGPGVDLAVASSQGITMRTALQWLPDFLSMGVVVQAFGGSGVIDATRAYRITTATS